MRCKGICAKYVFLDDDLVPILHDPKVEVEGKIQLRKCEEYLKEENILVYVVTLVAVPVYISSGAYE